MMPSCFEGLRPQPLAAAMPAWRVDLTRATWRPVCEQARVEGARLVALWGSDETDIGAGYALHAALLFADGLYCLRLALAEPAYPGIADLFPPAGRMQRAVRDLLGIHAEDEADARRWLRHGAWPEDVFPLRKSVSPDARFESGADDYAFVKVQGEGVHEIPVGPVHAGTIEPGHFRFSIIGEAVLRLEERLGYKHKGIEKRAEGMRVADAARLAARVSGDSTVAYAWAYAQALEGITAAVVPERGIWLRAILLELERVHNHLGDLGYLGNDVALAFGLVQFWQLKERVLRLNAELFGHRYLMDLIVPGGVVRDLPLDGPQKLFELAGALDAEVRVLRAIYDEHAGVQDRFIGAGQVTPQLARTLGLTGLAARASALAQDLRVDHPIAPYDRLGVHMAAQVNGDVAARVAVRFDEVIESLRLIRALLGQAPAGPVAVAPGEAPAGGYGVGLIEGWRGEVLVAVEIGPAERIRRMHPHDPSWQNWPLLERAVIDNIVPDFPLINKSFNLSYSGHDL